MHESKERFPDYVMRVLPPQLMKVLWTSYNDKHQHHLFFVAEPTPEHKRELRDKRKPSQWDSDELINLFGEIKRGAIKRIK